MARGLYGRVVPVRPALDDQTPSTCLRGHSLAIASARSGYHHWYGLTEITCGVCHTLGDQLASWCLVDPSRQYTLCPAPSPVWRSCGSRQSCAVAWDTWACGSTAFRWPTSTSRHADRANAQSLSTSAPTSHTADAATAASSSPQCSHSRH